MPATIDFLVDLLDLIIISEQVTIITLTLCVNNAMTKFYRDQSDGLLNQMFKINTIT